MSLKRKIFSIFKYGVLSVASLFLVIYATNSLVISTTKGQVYDDIEAIPKNKVGLLLGTGKYLRSGRINIYYKNRIDATIALFKQGKISHVIISGDNHIKTYDEPTEMKNDLIAGGIPAERIHLDYAGFRTLDSIVRCREVFGQDKFTIISQKFHNERALFLAKSKEIQAVGFNAKDVPPPYGNLTQRREYLARVKMMMDLIFGKQPKFLGAKINIDSE